MFLLLQDVVCNMADLVVLCVFVGGKTNYGNVL